MNRVSVLRLACMLAVFALAPLARGADCAVPVQLPDKPQLDQFADYSTFLVEVMKYKAKKREQAEHKQKCPMAYVEKRRPSRDPTKIEGPETLSDALQRTRKIPRIDYSRHQKWYDRTTSRSFPLPDLGGDELSSNTIETSLEKMRYKPKPEPEAQGAEKTGYRERGAMARAKERDRMKERDKARARMKERDKDKPLPGSEWLPDIYSQEFSGDELSGKASSESLLAQFSYRFLEREQALDTALSSTGRFGELASVTATPTPQGGRLVYYVSLDDNTILTGGTVHAEDCLSSCVNN